MYSEVPHAPKTGLVLSGGGMRGAYEVGVVSGIIDALRPRPGESPIFRIFSGASVGSINAAYLAANADFPDHGVARLAEIWRSLKLEDHARVRPLGLASWPSSLRSKLKLLSGSGEDQGTSLLDTRALEVVVRRSIDWDRLHRVVDSGRVLALLVAALHVASGRTIMFTEHAPGMNVVSTRDDRRAMVFEPVTADHVLASAAIPLLFPTRRIGDHYYCDGGLRFNTPISPAIRAGADRIVVITVRYAPSVREVTAAEEAEPAVGRSLSPMFLIGKLLNALLLDPVSYDLHVLGRLNEVVQVLEQTLSPGDFDRVQRVWVEHRGMPYRHLRSLVFTPSRDLGELAGSYLRSGLKMDKLSPVIRYMLERATNGMPNAEADWASYLLFDGGFARELIAIGHADALARRDEIREFFQRS